MIIRFWSRTCIDSPISKSLLPLIHINKILWLFLKCKKVKPCNTMSNQWICSQFSKFKYLPHLTASQISNWKNLVIFNFLFYFILSYSKCSNLCQISKLLSKFECLFTFYYLDGANSHKADLNIYNLWTG